MQSAAAPHLALRCLLVRGLPHTLLICGLGVEEKLNGICEVPELLLVISFSGIEAKDKIDRSRPRILDVLEQQKLYIILLLFLLTCNGQVLTLSCQL